MDSPSPDHNVIPHVYLALFSSDRGLNWAVGVSHLYTSTRAGDKQDERVTRTEFVYSVYTVEFDPSSQEWVAKFPRNQLAEDFSSWAPIGLISLGQLQRHVNLSMARSLEGLDEMVQNAEVRPDRPGKWL